MSLRRVCARIDVSAIKNNVKVLYEHMPVSKPIMAVIKADGYGHGAINIARILDKDERIFGFAVATSEEAFELRDEGISKPILVLGYVFIEDYARMIVSDIRFTIFTYEMAVQLSKIGQVLNKKAKVHIKVDTGMGRIGIRPQDDDIELMKRINALEGLYLEGIFTHFSRCDEADKTFTDEQYTLFAGYIDELKNNDICFDMVHCANSAGILEYPTSHRDFVRAGIVLYGLWPSDEVVKAGIGLKPALSLISHIVYVKTVPKGTPISYGATFITDKEMKIATIPVGYADGYPRSLSNKGYVLIRGCKAPILGRICMDQMMVDVSDIDGVEELDEVVLIGQSGNEIITAEELGNLSGRFNYELVCDISERVPRIYVSNEE